MKVCTILVLLQVFNCAAGGCGSLLSCDLNGPKVDLCWIALGDHVDSRKYKPIRAEPQLKSHELREKVEHPCGRHCFLKYTGINLVSTIYPTIHHLLPSSEQNPMMHLNEFLLFRLAHRRMGHTFRTRTHSNAIRMSGPLTMRTGRYMLEALLRGALYHIIFGWLFCLRSY